MLDHARQRDLFGIVLSLLCFSQQMPGTCAANPLRLEPQSVMVLFGSSVSVNCSTNITHEGMGWESSQEPVDIMKGVQLIPWTVKSLTHWDIKPLCFITEDGENHNTVELNITIYKPPDEVSIRTVNHTGQMIEGRQYELQCEVKNVAPVRLLTVNWYKGPDLVKSENFSDETPFPDNKTVTLQISPNRTDDGVQYTCEAELNLEPQEPLPSPSEPLDIIVDYSPSDIKELQDEEVSSGKDLVLKCSSNARPRPEYEWIYHQTSNVWSEDQDGISLLHINQAVGENIGTYSCNASNYLGGKIKTVRVNVQGAKAVCPLVIEPDSVTLEYGKLVSVQCTSSISNANIYWNLLNVTNGNTLIIDSIVFAKYLDWNGTVSCHGQFVGLDDCQKDLHITIYKRPDMVSISTLGHTNSMIEGNNYTLRCDVQNVAPTHLLTVNWYKGLDLVKKQHFNKTEEPANISTTLKIFPSRNDDKMQYKCEAVLKNVFNESSDVLNITVHYKPTITSPLPSRVPVFRGYPTVLVCEATGYPEPTITWVFNNEISRGGNLTVKESDGDYTCVASNSVSSDTRRVTVVLTDASCKLVLTPPELLVEYGAPASVDCSTPSFHTGIRWDAPQGEVGMVKDVQVITWKVDSLVHWDIQPVCFLNTVAKQCHMKLPVTVYKRPDKVTISIVGDEGKIIEGNLYELRCDIYNFAPAHLLIINWYRGHHTVAKTNFYDPTKTPVNHSTSFHMASRRVDDGVCYRCEAELKPSGTGTRTKPFTMLASQALCLNVQYSPEFTSEIEFFNETTETIILNCTVMANPPPNYFWNSTNVWKEFNRSHPVLILSPLDSGNYTCVAWNEIDSSSKLFIVQVKHLGGGSRTTFWAIVGSFLGLAVVMIVGYVLVRKRTIKK